MIEPKKPQKKSHSWKKEIVKKREILHSPWEEFLEPLLETLTKASYEIALKWGFPGTFFHFLSDFQEAVQNLLQRSGWHDFEKLFSHPKKNWKGKEDHKATYRIH